MATKPRRESKKAQKGLGNVDQELCKRLPKQQIPFLALPPEIHLKILPYLNPIDTVCLSLVNKYFHCLCPAISNIPLTTGSPDSSHPVPNARGCRHCAPVLYYPAHCELHYHLRSFIPRHLKFCAGPCNRFTACEGGGLPDSKDYCGRCQVPYRRKFERGRRMIDMQRPGEKQERLRKWYNA